MSGVRDIDGYSLKFSDRPIRYKFAWWRAELSLVGKNGGVFHEITTLKYGFNISMGNYSIQPLQSIPYLNTYKWLKK